MNTRAESRLLRDRMLERISHRPVPPAQGHKYIRMGLILWSSVGFGLISFLLTDRDAVGSEAKLYLIPWCFATAAVTLAPAVYLFYKGRFDPFHPLVFSAWSYVFPGFVIGGLMLAFGISKPYFLSYVSDERYNLPLTLVYVMLGYGGLVIGFAIPFAGTLGKRVGRRLPNWEWNNDRLHVPGLLLWGLGILLLFIGISSGLLGYQQQTEAGQFDAAIQISSMIALAAVFLLWIYVFRSGGRPATRYAVAGVLIIYSLVSSAFIGARGNLLRMLLAVGFAFALSGRRFAPRHIILGTLLVFVALIGGMIYGTTFRSIKQYQEQASLEEFSDVISRTVDRLYEQDLGTTVQTGIEAMSERLDATSSLAVVVANHEALAPYEDAWGISNNIWNDMVNSVIPRVLWPNKPVPIDPRSYADLYFNFSDSAFTITPMGDLLRNFGPVGVPIGMIILGFFVRVLYAALVEDQPFYHWRRVMFYMLFSSISFEGSYGLILPFMVRVGFVTFLGMLLIQLYFRATRPRLSSFLSLERS